MGKCSPAMLLESKKSHSSCLLFCRNKLGHVLLICSNKLESVVSSNSAKAKMSTFSSISVTSFSSLSLYLHLNHCRLKLFNKQSNIQECSSVLLRRTRAIFLRYIPFCVSGTSVSLILFHTVSYMVPYIVLIIV